MNEYGKEKLEKIIGTWKNQPDSRNNGIIAINSDYSIQIVSGECDCQVIDEKEGKLVKYYGDVLKLWCLDKVLASARHSYSNYYVVDIDYINISATNSEYQKAFYGAFAGDKKENKLWYSGNVEAIRDKCCGVGHSVQICLGL